MQSPKPRHMHLLPGSTRVNFLAVTASVTSSSPGLRLQFPHDDPMFASRGHARTTLFSRARRRLNPQLPTIFSATAATTGKNAAVLEPQNDIARKLRKDGSWAAARKGANIDNYRVNVVSDKLCDDIVDYIGPTLARHKGCDLLDVFPGVGIWSTKLNNLLQPRSHIMLEPDTDFYRPYLEPLLARPGTRLLPQSGIIWEQLTTVLNPAELPHQVERKYAAHETPQRNDTLLVTMNLSMFPKRKFRAFDSLSQLVVFQLLSSIRPGSLFQKYGLVRMLLWLPEHEKGVLVPRTIQGRKKIAIESEISTDWVSEVAGGDPIDPEMVRSAYWFRRDQVLEHESTQAVLKRMRKGRFALPPGREPKHVLDYLEYLKANPDPSATDGKRIVERPFIAEMEKLEADFAAGLFEKGSEQYKRLKTLHYLRDYKERRSNTVVEMIQKRDAITRVYARAGKNPERLARAAALGQAWIDEVNGFEKTLRSSILLQRDNIHALRQDPPVLNWDRRPYEPLVVRSDEFYPRVPTALLDIQPKAVAPVLRDMGPGSGRGGDMFDLILRGLTHRGTEPVPKLLNHIYPGADEGVTPNCPSLANPALGGSPLEGIGGVPTRALNQRQFVEITEAWMKWPFKPSYAELVSKSLDEVADADGEEVTGNLGGDF